MNEYAIISDSCCDLPFDLAQKMEIRDVPMNISINNTSYQDWLDRREMKPSEFFKLLRNGTVGKTAAANVGDIINIMSQEAEKGNDILYISFSSGMSSSYQAAMLAKNIVSEDYPNIRIEVFDTKSGSVGQACLLYCICKQRKEGKTMDELISWLNNNWINARHYFMVDNLEHLKNTGRISSLSGFVGGALGIRQILGLDMSGKIKSIEKVRGRKAAIRELAEKVISECTNKMAIFIVHSDCQEDAINLKSLIQEKIKDANIFIGNVGFIIGNNVGPDALAVGFLGNGR